MFACYQIAAGGGLGWLSVSVLRFFSSVSTIIPNWGLGGTQYPGRLLLLLKALLFVAGYWVAHTIILVGMGWHSASASAFIATESTIVRSGGLGGSCFVGW